MLGRVSRLAFIACAAALIAASCVAPPSPGSPPPAQLPVAPGGAEATSALVTVPSEEPKPFDFPDPSVINVGGTYYGYGTGSSTFAYSTVPVVRSTDLANWTYVGEGLPGGTNAWADLFAPVVG